MKVYSQYLLKAFLIILVGCGVNPPTSISIDTRFSQEETAIITDSLGHWCQAVGWCPLVVIDGEAWIFRDEDFQKHEKRQDVRAYNSEATGNIHIDPEFIFYEDFFRMVVLHELGHYAIEYHEESSWLMKAEHNTVPLAYCVDKIAANRWCLETWCPKEPESTCD